MGGARNGLETTADGSLRLSGPLTFATVGAVLERSSPLLPARGTAVIDLSAVDQTDSAALALIVEWQKLARRRGLSLELRGLPARLQALLSAADLDSLCSPS